jgi:hypothetical protein
MEDNKAQKQFPWATAVVAVAIVIVTALALIAYLKTGRGVKDTIDKGISLTEKVIDKAPEIARNFKTGKITHTFRESISHIASTQGDVLEVAVSRSDETFQRSDEKRIGWDYIYLGTTVVEIRVPVTFRYHLRLSEAWRLASRDHVCLVLAPQVRPSLPPAIHTGSMEKRAESGWARFDKNDKLDELEKSITDTLERRAMDATHFQLVREACRQSVAEFVKRWLMREEHWRNDRFTAIVVVFPDETTVTSDQELSQFHYDPTIKLD